jgi:hypothetical protein
VLTTVSRRFAPDFTTEGTEITETDRKERRVRIRIQNPFFPASVASVLLTSRFFASREDSLATPEHHCASPTLWPLLSPLRSQLRVAVAMNHLKPLWLRPQGCPVHSVVKLRIAPSAVKSRENRG